MLNQQPQRDDREIQKPVEKITLDRAYELAQQALQQMFTNTSQEFKKFFSIFYQEIANMIQTIEELKEANSSLQNDNTKLRKERSEIDQRLTHALSEFDKLKKSEDGKTNLAVAELARRFRLIRDQDFQNIAREISNYLSKLESKYAGYINIVNIRAILARHILLEDIYQDSTAIINNIRTFLGIQESSVGWAKIQEELQDLIENSHRLVEDIRNTDPPGKLVGESFNPQQHENIYGSEAHGRVSSIIFPSYQVKDTILVKAQVQTEPYQSRKELNICEQKPSLELLQPEQDAEAQKPSAEPSQSEQNTETQNLSIEPAQQDESDQCQ